MKNLLMISSLGFILGIVLFSGYVRAEETICSYGMDNGGPLSTMVSLENMNVTCQDLTAAGVPNAPGNGQGASIRGDADDNGGTNYWCHKNQCDNRGNNRACSCVSENAPDLDVYNFSFSPKEFQQCDIEKLEFTAAPTQKKRCGNFIIFAGTDPNNLVEMDTFLIAGKNSFITRTQNINLQGLTSEYYVRFVHQDVALCPNNNKSAQSRIIMGDIEVKGTCESLPSVVKVNGQPVNKGFFIKNHKNKIKLEGITPNGKASLLWGFKKGDGKVSTDQCGEVALDMIPKQTLAKFKANEDGVINNVFKVPSTSQNRAFLQVIDLTACTVGPLFEVKLSN